MGCLISIPIILLFIVLFFGSALLRIVQALFGKGFSTTYDPNTNNRQSQSQYTDEDTVYSDDGPSYRRRHKGQRHKIFGPDEGEYVDFEEIKDKE